MDCGNVERKVDKKEEFRGRRIKKEKEKEARIRGGAVARLQFDCRYMFRRTVQYTVHECDG
jgi:hypothetical protein